MLSRCVRRITPARLHCVARCVPRHASRSLKTRSHCVPPQGNARRISWPSRSKAMQLSTRTGGTLLLGATIVLAMEDQPQSTRWSLGLDDVPLEVLKDEHLRHVERLAEEIPEPSKLWKLLEWACMGACAVATALVGSCVMWSTPLAVTIAAGVSSASLLGASIFAWSYFDSYDDRVLARAQELTVREIAHLPSELGKCLEKALLFLLPAVPLLLKESGSLHLRRFARVVIEDDSMILEGYVSAKDNIDDEDLGGRRAFLECLDDDVHDCRITMRLVPSGYSVDVIVEHASFAAPYSFTGRRGREFLAVENGEIKNLQISYELDD